MPSQAWNLRVYRAWAPVYDAVLERFFRPGRQAAARVLDLRPGERVLLAGVGTGLDLPYLPAGARAVGIDVSPAMLGRAARRTAPCRVELRQGDAADTGEPDGSFDAAILALVLSVVPEPRRLLAETLRVVRPGGRVVVFDKFAPDEASAGRRVLNGVTRFFGTDISRRLRDLITGQQCEIVHDEASLLGGQYRVVLLTRTPKHPAVGAPA